MSLTQSERIRAASAVDGYYLPRPHENPDNGGTVAAFERAKAEYIATMRKNLANVEILDYASFMAGKRGR